MSAATLVLNYDNSLLSIQPYTKAYSKVVKEKAVVIEEYEDKRLQSWNDAMYAPAVIRMLYFVKTSRRRSDRVVTFSRKNVWLRDGGTCQYCGQSISLDNMHWDHVIPRCRGGMSSFENLVCSCLKCNNKKDSRTPEEANMKLIKTPTSPRYCTTMEKEVLLKLKAMSNLPHDSWRNYIYWNTPLDK
jgi:5-methylcytosine-specific restriction endonuclease McrA